MINVNKKLVHFGLYNNLDDACTVRRAIMQHLEPEFIEGTDTEVYEPEKLSEIIAECTNNIQQKIRAIILY